MIKRHQAAFDNYGKMIDCRFMFNYFYKIENLKFVSCIEIIQDVHVKRYIFDTVPFQ